jgi:hypothetical protein
LRPKTSVLPAGTAKQPQKTQLEEDLEKYKAALNFGDDSDNEKDREDNNWAD